ncbi:HNH endonuclease [Cellulomonas sp. NPDC057328]|uniref:HNH endonuclease n=1 Tax=Cellulomonas sp. NPDC057328 TaxID=3346101 RepID=UPI003633DE1D
MGLLDITADSVSAALAEFDDLGREAFLAKYSFGSAHTYYVERDGNMYDSRAIVGAAHVHATGEPLLWARFHGGDATVAPLLRALGFNVVSRKRLDWDWQEILLACALVYGNGWRELRTPDPKVQELSQVLRHLPIYPQSERPPNFRSPDAVSRKTTDLATAHPDYRGKPTRGNKLDRLVIDQFIADPTHMLDLASALRHGLQEGLFTDISEARVRGEEDPESEEGGLLQKVYARRERDPKLRAAKIDVAKQLGRGLGCEICGFDFEATYGNRGAGYVECHHIVPLHVTGRRTVRLDDLILICANCHRMVHRKSPWLRPEEVRQLLRTRT